MTIFALVLNSGKHAKKNLLPAQKACIGHISGVEGRGEVKVAKHIYFHQLYRLFACKCVQAF